MTTATYTTMDEYLLTCDVPYREKLQELRCFIHECIPEVSEKISWGLPTFMYHGSIVQIGACKGYVGFYPGKQAIDQFREELSKYTLTKCAIHLPMEEFPYDVLKRILLFCKEENEKEYEKK